MSLLAQLLIGLVALLHVWFLVLEMFLWDKPQGMKTFKTEEAFAKQTKPMAQNQGLYNGFLAVGLLWSLIPIGATNASQSIATFFLVCIIVAGAFGAATVSKRILYVQAGPALIALGLVWFL